MIVAVKVLVAGASGFVGRRLCAALVDAGHDVRAMTRHPDSYQGAGTAVRGDVDDAASWSRRCAGARAPTTSCIPSTTRTSPAWTRPARGRSLALLRRVGMGRIVYLGGLGNDEDDLSAHLRSRREVETLLGSTGVPVTTLRAGIIVGHGGISWEMTRQPSSIFPR